MNCLSPEDVGYVMDWTFYMQYWQITLFTMNIMIPGSAGYFWIFNYIIWLWLTVLMM